MLVTDEHLITRAIALDLFYCCAGIGLFVLALVLGQWALGLYIKPHDDEQHQDSR